MRLKWQRLTDTAKIPTYAKPGDAGFDFCASENEYVRYGQITIIFTGLTVEIPPGYEIQVRPRSGLAAREGIIVVNAPGTIDSGYRGEIKIILSRIIPGQLRIISGDRIAQGVLAKIETAEMEEGVLSETERGIGGLGSTGK